MLNISTILNQQHQYLDRPALKGVVAYWSVVILSFQNITPLALNIHKSSESLENIPRGAFCCLSKQTK